MNELPAKKTAKKAATFSRGRNAYEAQREGPGR
jgi:hypothetical protein